MTQPPAQSSGSDVSKVESDIQQTVTLAGTIVTLVREPISLLYQNVVKTQNLKRSLGVWQKRMLDRNGYCGIPVLRLKEFEEYLVTIDGVVPASTGQHQSQNPDDTRLSWNWTSWNRPRSSSSSTSRPLLPADGTACWAWFLFAMGIHPTTEIIIDSNKRRIVDRKPSTDGFISTQNGGIEMEVYGAVLCHVFNLILIGKATLKTSACFLSGAWAGTILAPKLCLTPTFILV
ncbi:hypothetical protein K456DRAFT_1173853 [Colletotrichum gloeosporioides 23]|nr:hypothetical protein K456DRAFT_1173853 [Colletotrichum gloeosporioides 23]